MSLEASCFHVATALSVVLDHAPRPRRVGERTRIIRRLYLKELQDFLV